MKRILDWLDHLENKQDRGWCVEPLNSSPAVKLCYRDQTSMRRTDEGGFQHCWVMDENQSYTAPVHADLDQGLGARDAELILQECRDWVKACLKELQETAEKWPVTIMVLSNVSAKALVAGIPDEAAPSYRDEPSCRLLTCRGASRVLVILPYPDVTGSARRWRSRLRLVICHELEHVLQFLRVGEKLSSEVVILAEMCSLLAEWKVGKDHLSRGYVEYMHGFRTGLHLGLQLRDIRDLNHVGYCNSPFLLHLDRTHEHFAQRLWTEPACLAALKGAPYPRPGPNPFRAMDLLLEQHESSLDAEWLDFCAGLLLTPHPLEPMALMQRHYNGLAVMPTVDLDLAAWQAKPEPFLLRVNTRWSCQWLRICCADSGPVRILVTVVGALTAAEGSKIILLQTSVGKKATPLAVGRSQEVEISGDMWLGLVGLGCVDFFGSASRDSSKGTVVAVAPHLASKIVRVELLP